MTLIRDLPPVACVQIQHVSFGHWVETCGDPVTFQISCDGHKPHHSTAGTERVITGRCGLVYQVFDIKVRTVSAKTGADISVFL